MLSRVYLIVCGSLSLLTLAAEQPARPVCNAVTMGTLWPAQANGNAKLTNKLFNCGELKVCTRGRWKYRWSPLSVRVDQLTGSSKPAPPGCTALMNELGKVAQEAASREPIVAQGMNASAEGEASR